jgi:general secretion pathway protein E
VTGISVETIGNAAEAAIDRVIQVLIEHGHCDEMAIERARRVTAETEQRLDSVLIRLGIVAERALAEAYAASLGVGLVAADQYPVSEPLFPERLSAKFLRNARVLPLKVENGTLVIAVADPLDSYNSAAIAAATGLVVRIEVATPIEMEAAFDRLYPENGTETAAAQDEKEGGAPEPLEEDPKRLKDLASEAPVIRLVNQLITRS